MKVPTFELWRHTHTQSTQYLHVPNLIIFACFMSNLDCTGGYAIFYLGCYAYIADISEPENRTRRLAMLDGLFPLGFYIGNASSGVIKVKLKIQCSQQTNEPEWSVKEIGSEINVYHSKQKFFRYFDRRFFLVIRLSASRRQIEGLF